MNRRRIITTVAGCTLAGTLLTTTPAWADGPSAPTATAPTATASAYAPTPPAGATPGATPGGGDVRAGAKRLCRRVPGITTRINRQLARLNGPVGTRGSIATLAQAAANAQAAGETAIYTYREDRLTFRRALVGTLQQRLTDLGQVGAWCQANGLN